MLSLYSPVTTPWHRLPAGVKLAGLMVFALGLFWMRAPWMLGLALALVLAAWAPGGRVFCRQGLRLLRPLIPFVVIVGAWHLWTGETRQGAMVVLRLLAAIAAANLVTMTTRLSDIIAVIERVAAPLARLGMKPRILALAVALVIRFIPVTAERVARLREAWRARSPRPAGWRVALPATLGALDDADHVADALRARGGAG